MKKVRLLKFLFLLLIFPMIFSSCNDEEEPSPTLVGYWELRSIEIRNAGNLNGFYNPLLLDLINLEIEFFDNNEFTQTVHVVNGLSEGLEGNFETNGDNTELTLMFSAEDEVWEMDLQLNQMFLSRQETFNLDDDDDDETPPVQVNADLTYRYTKIF